MIPGGRTSRHRLPPGKPVLARRLKPFARGLGVLLTAGAVWIGCAEADRSPPQRQVLEQHLLGGLPLGADPEAFEATHYAAVFKAERLVSVSLQFFTARDYHRVYEGLRPVMGGPTSEHERRVSGPLGPTVHKTRTTVWQTTDYALELRSNPGGTGIAILKFSTP